jgi:UDP-N-acetylmuramoyl-tripeptide--D-alanyl-D-alanine ligase
MKKLPIENLARIINAKPAKITDGFFTGVSTDSRTIKAGDCFFAIAGDNFDGHNYVAQALEKGAACAVVSKDVSGNKILKVDDTIKALGTFAARYRQDCNFKVVAITGSVGKTTTRHITYHVLSQYYRTFQSPKNFNNNIGLPLTLLAVDPTDEIVIVELGSNYPGEIAYLTRIAAPDIAVVTKISPAHLAGLRDIETIKKEKFSIAEGLRPNGVFITDAVSKIKLRNVTYQNTISKFTIEGTDITLPLLGPGNIENAVTAWAICRQFKITLDQFANAVKTLPAVPMRAELLQIGKLTVLGDYYNANPASMKNSLDILANLDCDKNRRKVFICGDMAELGRQSRILHEELGKYVADAKVQLLLVVGAFSRFVAQTAKKIAEYDLQAECFEDTISVCDNLKKFIKENDIILVKGSRAAKLETVVEKLKELYN